MAIDSSGIVSALGAGSGINIRDLAKGLTDAEINPRKNAIQAKIDRSEAKISGYSAVMAVLDGFKATIDQIDSTTDFAQTSVRSSNPLAFGATTTSLAAPGSHSIEVNSLARAQRSISSGGFDNLASPLNDGDPFEFRIRINGVLVKPELQPFQVSQTEANASALVNKINQLGLGITAQLVDTGQEGADRYRIALTGQTGASNSFTFEAKPLLEQQTIAFSAASADGTISVAGVSVAVSASDTAAAVTIKVRDALLGSIEFGQNSGRTVTIDQAGQLRIGFDLAEVPAIIVTDNSSGVTFNVTDNAPVAGLSFTAPPGQTASNASLVVNGVEITRATNSIDNVIPGVTLDLQSTTSAPASLTVVREPSGVKQKIQAIVTAYNDMVSDFNVLTGPKSDDPDDVFSGSLRGDSTVRSVLAQVRTVIFGESETAGSAVRNMRDLGVSIDRNGVLSLNETTLDTAISRNFEEVVQMLAGRQVVTQGDQTVTKRGIGVAMSARLRELMGPSGIVMNQSSSAESQVARHKRDLVTLEARMEKILERYTKQFAAMESLVGQMNAMRENLKGQFENLANAYKK